MMSGLEIILVFAAVVLALVYLFRIGAKKPDGGHGCGGHCGCSKHRLTDDQKG